jgi:phytoene dehydrogenase-like protein
VRTDADNLALLESSRARHKTLHTERVRVERDIETNAQRLAEAQAAARARFGTDDVEKLREIVRENYRANTADTDAYVQSLDRIDRELAALKTPPSA